MGIPVVVLMVLELWHCSPILLVLPWTLLAISLLLTVEIIKLGKFSEQVSIVVFLLSYDLNMFRKYITMYCAVL